VYWFGILCLGSLIFSSFLLVVTHLVKCNFGLWIWISLFLASGLAFFGLILLKESTVNKIGEERIKTFLDKHRLFIYFFVCLLSIVIFYFLNLNGFYDEVYGK
jgi:hypothetical protein